MLTSPDKTEVYHVEADEKLDPGAENTDSCYKYVDKNGSAGGIVIDAEVEKRIMYASTFAIAMAVTVNGSTSPLAGRSIFVSCPS